MALAISIICVIGLFFGLGLITLAVLKSIWMQAPEIPVEIRNLESKESFHK